MRSGAVARTLVRFAVAGVLAWLPAACASHAPPITTASADSAGPAGRARLEVINRSTSDMDVYFTHAGQRVRLGIAPSSQRTRFSLSPALLAGGGFMRFEAGPIEGGAPLASTEPTSVTPGDVITLDIPPR